MKLLRRILWCAFLPAACLPPGGAAAVPGPPLEACEEQYASRPESRAAARCFYEAAKDPARREEAARRLRGLLAGTPLPSPWMHFYLGNIEYIQRGPADVLYREAARGFAQAGEVGFEVEARVNLVKFLIWHDRFAEAAVELEVAKELAGEREDLQTELQIQEAQLMRRRGARLTTVYRLLRELESRLFPEGDVQQQQECLQALMAVTFRLGRLAESEAYGRRYAELAAERGGLWAIANARYMEAAGHLERLPRPGAREGAIEKVTAALDAARAAGNRSAEVQALHLLGRLEGGPEGEARLEECVRLAEAAARPASMSSCLHALAANLVDDRPDRATRLIDRALRVALESENPWTAVSGWPHRMAVAWKTLPAAEALELSLLDLEMIEALCDLQRVELGRTGLFSVWSEAHYWLTGRLLQGSTGLDRRLELEHAHALNERLHATLLLQRLAAPGVGAATAADHSPSPGERETLRRIVELNRRLMTGGADETARLTALAELERLELRAAERRVSAGDREGPARPVVASLDQIERTLAGDEALLSFHVGVWEDVYGNFAGGSFLLVSTSGGTRAYPLPGRAELEPALPVYLGLFGRRDGSEALSGKRLYRGLLAEALGDLPPEVDRLIVVPDGVVHRLPLAALRADAEAPPLAQRYEISLQPSASLWHRWRVAPGSAPSGAAVLALADPDLPSGDRASAERAGILGVAALGRLPHARKEARRVVRRFRGRSHLLVGAQASEAVVKRVRFDDYQVVHLAAHAVTDARIPDRSAIVLAPGSEHEDGLLQAREIRELPLSGQVVILSACRSASGPVLQGEGVMGLARAFFAAGARAVVGSLWPLRDDDARLFFDRLYRHLAGGETLSAALAATQRELVAGGLPAATWSGIVLLGDGELRLHRPAASRGWWRLAAGVTVFLAVAAFLAARRTRRLREQALP